MGKKQRTADGPSASGLSHQGQEVLGFPGKGLLGPQEKAVSVVRPILPSSAFPDPHCGPALFLF